jgi:adenine-specific DNA-methyltransferase
MIKYIGSKRVLVPWIVSVIQHVNRVSPVETIVDLFSGSGRVGHALKKEGFKVHSNDLYGYAFVIAKCLVESDASRYTRQKIEPLLAELNALEGEAGYFTNEFCVESAFFKEKNGMRVDAARKRIDELAPTDPLLHSILLTSLMLAADRVDSTTGLQMAFLKAYAPRAENDLKLVYPDLVDGTGKATQEDAIELAPQLNADLVYLDPPYNQHSYLSNYHIWETLVLNDSPAAYGMARKREDCKVRKSPFNFKREALPAMAALVKRLDVPHLLVSFSDEGFYGIDDIEKVLQERGGYIRKMARPHRRYIGARIGIYNQKGVKVGKVSHVNNREFLLLATRDKAVYDSFEEDNLALTEPLAL